MSELLELPHRQLEDLREASKKFEAVLLWEDDADDEWAEFVAVRGWIEVAYLRLLESNRVSPDWASVLDALKCVDEALGTFTSRVKDPKGRKEVNDLLEATWEVQAGIKPAIDRLRLRQRVELEAPTLED